MEALGCARVSPPQGGRAAADLRSPASLGPSGKGLIEGGSGFGLASDWIVASSCAAKTNGPEGADFLPIPLGELSANAGLVWR